MLGFSCPRGACLAQEITRRIRIRSCICNVSTSYGTALFSYGNRNTTSAQYKRDAWHTQPKPWLAWALRHTTLTWRESRWQAAIRATRATFPTVAPCGGRAASCGASHRLHGSPPPPKKMDGRLPRCPAQSPPAVPRWRSQLGVRPASGAEPRGTEYDGSPRSGTASVRTPPLVFLLLLTAPAEQDDSVGDPRDNPRRLSTPSRGRQWTSVGSANSSAQKCPANVHPELNVTLFFCFRSQAAYIARPSAVLVPHSSSSTVSCAPLHVQRDCDGHRSNHVARRFAEPGY